MKRVGLVLHHDREEAVALGRTLAARMVDRGLAVEAPPQDADRLGADAVVSAERFPADLDLVIVLGGDGTLLRAAHLVGDAAPLLGVNLGRLGFLSALERSEAEEGVLAAIDDGFTEDERTIITGTLTDGDEVHPVWALNDVIIAKVDIGRAVKLSVSIGGERFVAWSSDGVIVATPTGSTAYSFSAGGPVVSPALDCLLVTPVAPHGLFDRTVVVPAGEEVAITVLPDPDRASLSADGGEAVPVRAGAVLRLRAGDARVRLARVRPAPFWSLVNRKLGLPPEAR